MSDFTFLTKEQIYGNNKLSIFDKYRPSECTATDFSILLGCSLIGNFGDWWTKTAFGDNPHYDVNVAGPGGSAVTKSNNFCYGARPALPYSLISSSSSNIIRISSGIKEVEYGEYPQTLVDEVHSQGLEVLFDTGQLKKTGKSYTTNQADNLKTGNGFYPKSYTEYEYNGKKYIRFVGISNGEDEKLSDGRTIEIGVPYWVAVEPIKWLVDVQAGITLSKKILFSGVQFQNSGDYTGDFDKTDIKKFMDNFFAKEIISNKTNQASSSNIPLSNIKLRLLKEKQLFGDCALDIIKKYSAKAYPTDLSVILGLNLRDITYFDKGCYWSEIQYDNTDAYYIGLDGDYYHDDVYRRCYGIRPVVSYSLIKNNSTKKTHSVDEIICGEYPQRAATNQRKLSEAFVRGDLVKTGKSYVFDSRKYNECELGFKPVTYDEYMFEGRKYIQVFVNSYYDGNNLKLSNGDYYHDGDVVWIEVLPVEWYVDKTADLAISKNVLVAGIRYADETKYNGDFSKTEMYEYLNKYMVKDLFSSEKLLEEEVINTDEKSCLKKQNPYNFNFDDVTEEDIIRGAVESNVSVFLHGRSSEGKSARVKQLDPECEIIYMRNATPDSLNGKSVYNATTGEMIDVPPTWYTKVKEKCEKEPDKIHIIFFDELTNALPSIQGMAFNIILDGEVNGKWKLPKNARIVAAGNDLNDSLAANQMAEPLFNRFAHVYINTTVDSWLKWASTPKESYERLDYEDEVTEMVIHPSIYAYVAYKSYCGNDVLRTPYNGEKPNADPRKWEMASKVLYKTKNPEMLRALIGEELTRDFVEFAKEQVITVEDVINHNYTEDDFEMNVSQKFATAVGLSSVDEEHFEIVREFMRQVGEEARAAFESMWAHGDEARLEKIASLQITEKVMRK